MIFARKTEEPSLRSKLILTSCLSAGVITLVAGLLIVGMSYRYLVANCRDVQRLILGDLKASYDTSVTKNFFNEAFTSETRTHGHDNVFLVLIRAGDGKVLSCSEGDHKVLQKIISRVIRGRREFRVRTTLSPKPHRYVSVRCLVDVMPDGNLLVVGWNATDYETFFFWMVGYTAGAFLLVMLLSTIMSYIQANRLIRPLKSVSKAANKIANGVWSERVDRVETPIVGREISALVKTFNKMCDANEKTITELRVLTDNIAHDLRTPLAHMRNLAELAREGIRPLASLPGEIAEETRAMLDLINTMLDISRSGFAIERTPREDVDVVDVVRLAADLYGVVADDRGVKMEVDTPEEAVFFNGHRGKLQQLVGNLVDNAIKFTPKDGRVTVSVARGKDHVELKVSDTGCGIPESDIPLVFNRFWRGDGSRSQPGNGLGLSLVKAIVTGYAGTIKVESQEGKGTVFTVSLPLKIMGNERRRLSDG